RRSHSHHFAGHHLVGYAHLAIPLLRLPVEDAPRRPAERPAKPAAAMLRRHARSCAPRRGRARSGSRAGCPARISARPRHFVTTDQELHGALPVDPESEGRWPSTSTRGPTAPSPRSAGPGGLTLLAKDTRGLRLRRGWIAMTNDWCRS